jgi:hypothetical protein
MGVRLTTTVLAVAACVAGVSVAAADLKRAAPKDVDLTGLWKLNPELSDDPQQVVTKKRKDNTDGGPISGGRRGGGVTVGTGGTGDVFGDILAGTIGGTIGRGGTVRRTGGGESDRPEGDPEPTDTRRVPLDSFLATREQLEIDQQPEAVTISSVDEASTCKPGETNKAPTPSGELVDLRCGWKGDTWVTELKAPDGVTRVTRYELRKKDQQLVMISEVKGGKTEFAGLQIKRVYDRIVM